MKNHNVYNIINVPISQRKEGGVLRRKKLICSSDKYDQ